jgi:hypothetical protein
MTIRKEPEGGEFKEMPTEKLYDLFLKLHGHLGRDIGELSFQEEQDSLTVTVEDTLKTL